MAIEAQLYSDNLELHSSNPKDLVMENNTHQQRQEKPLQYEQSMQCHHPQTQSLIHHGRINMAEDHQSVSFKHHLAYLIEKQRLEMNRFVITQNEKLKWALQEQSKQLLTVILKKYEAKIEYLVRQKDEEIAKAINKKTELEDFIKRVERENEAWQKIAKENEEMVFSLNNTIEQLKASASLSTNGAEDAESCCDVVVHNRATGSIEVKVEHNLEQISNKVSCKGCNFKSSSIIILPCRHLCLCQSCEPFLHSCPVCGTEKKATIHALI